MAHLSVVPDVVGDPDEMSATEARVLTERIRATSTQVAERGEELALQLIEAREHKAWAALGYVNWTAYIEAELPIRRSQAYRLIDWYKTLRTLADAAGIETSPKGDGLTEHKLREVRSHLDEVAAEVAQRVASGEEPNRAVVVAVAAARNLPRKLRVSKSADAINRVVTTALPTQFDILDDVFRRLDGVEPEQIDMWVKDLERVRRRLSLFIRDLKAQGGTQ